MSLNKSDVKVFISYHKPSIILKSDIMTPIHVGAKLSSLDLGVQRDDEGDNISEKNPKLCELTAQYWAWKNEDAEYYGFMHYRRQFIFEDIDECTDTGGLVHFECIDDDYIKKIGLDDEHIRNSLTGVDLIVPQCLDMWDFSCLTNEVQFSTLPNLHGRDFNTVCEVAMELFPEYTDSIEEFRTGHNVYWYNMFIMKKELFHSYCEWLFPILLESEKRIDFSEYDAQETRTLAFMAERLFSIFVNHHLKEKPDTIVKHLKMSFISNTDDNNDNSDSISDESGNSFVNPYGNNIGTDIKVSIVVPFYNAELYISKCLFSLINQSYRNIEVICVDDGSDDDGAEIVKATQNVDPRVKLIQQDNQYAGVARNNGFQYATGKYVIFFDADDYAEPACVERMLEAIEGEEADVAICSAKGLDNLSFREHSLGTCVLNAEALPKNNNVFSPLEAKDSLFQITAGWAWDKIFRTDFIRDNNLEFQDLRSSNDALFVNLACALANKIAIVPEILVVHRTHVTSSLEYTKETHWKCAVNMLRALRMDLIKRDLFETFGASYANFAVGTLVAYLTSTYNVGILDEIYTSINGGLVEELGLFAFSREQFLDKRIFDSFKYATENPLSDFLCHHIRFLDEILQENNELIWDWDHYIQNLKFTVDDLAEKSRKSKHWYFPEERYPNVSKYAIYGFGKVGKDFSWQLANSKHSELVAIIDKNYETINEPYLKDIKVGDLSILSDIEYDYVIISPRKEDIAKEIKAELISVGVEEGKIICPILDGKVMEE